MIVLRLFLRQSYDNHIMLPNRTVYAYWMDIFHFVISLSFE